MFKLLTILSLLTGCSFLKEYKDDNFVEESVESIIESKTGLDIDFTPSSPENLYHKLICR